MTVQELIDELSKVTDKSKEVGISHDYWSSFANFTKVDEELDPRHVCLDYDINYEYRWRSKE